MQILIETIIYLIAMMGIILTMTCFYDFLMFSDGRFNKTDYKKLDIEANNPVLNVAKNKIVIYTSNITKNQIKDLIFKIRDFDDKDFEKFLQSITIEIR